MGSFRGLSFLYMILLAYFMSMMFIYIADGLIFRGVVCFLGLLVSIFCYILNRLD